MLHQIIDAFTIRVFVSAPDRVDHFSSGVRRNIVPSMPTAIPLSHLDQKVRDLFGNTRQAYLVSVPS